jgi:polyhydroxybutyrate depolymerase
MRHRFFSFAALVAVLCVSTSSIRAQRTVVDSIQNQGFWRTFRVYLPAKYTPGSQRPLILHLHGYGSSAAVEQAFTNYMAVADTANFLIAYPNALPDASGTHGWNVGWPGVGNAVVDDVKFLSTLIDTLHARYTIDLKRVYASGISLGGFMSYQLGWKLSNRIAAIAPVSGSMYPTEYAKCAPPRPIPVMEIHGTADQVIPYNGSAFNIKTDTLMDFWVRHDHCIPMPSATNLPDISKTDGTSTTHFVWTAEVSRVSCELFRVIGGGHVNWPKTAGGAGDFDASTEIWRFFNKYTVGQFAGVAAAAQRRSDEALFYPNPCTEQIHRSASTQGNLSIFDALGREILSSNEATIDLHQLTPGFYTVRADQHGVIRTEKLVKQ